MSESSADASPCRSHCGQRVNPQIGRMAWPVGNLCHQGPRGPVGVVGSSSPRSGPGAPCLSGHGGAGPETAPAGLTRPRSNLWRKSLEACERETRVPRPASIRAPRVGGACPETGVCPARVAGTAAPPGLSAALVRPGVRGARWCRLPVGAHELGTA